nr:MAG TPA: terminase small subunit [Caudoviricetes sp.]
MAKYTEWLTSEGLVLVEGWARDGLIDEQIAKNMNVAYSTFREWKKKFPTLSAALKQGKEVSDRQVENALFKTATGYYYQEETVTNAGEIVTIKKYSKPNTTAQIFWLKNRKAEWTDRVDINAQIESKPKFDDIVNQLGGSGLDE